MEIQYVIKKSLRRSISIQVQNDGIVYVKSPKQMPVSEVEEFLVLKKQWILKRLEKIRLENEQIEKEGLFTQQELKEIKRKAKNIIPQRVEFYAQKSGISYKRIAIRLQKSRWGSCSAEENLNFNCLLVLMPIEILDSVIVHELCHRKHMNHSRAFYNEVYAIFPDYNRCDKWLKQNGKLYLRRAGL